MDQIQDDMKKVDASGAPLVAKVAFDDDLPYLDESGLIVVPYSLDTNDMKFGFPKGC